MLTTDEKEKIVQDFREGFQIPSYISDNAIYVLLDEAEAYLYNLNPSISAVDLAGINLLKNRMFYAFNHLEADFSRDYSADILTWQMAGLVGVEFE